MGQGEEVKSSGDSPVEIQERGEIFFFYRPKVGKEDVHGPDDVQRLYVVLRPESGERPVEVKQDPALSSGKESSAAGNKGGGGSSSGGGRDHEGGQGTQEVNIEEQVLMRFIILGRKSLPDTRHKSRPYWGFVEMVTTNVEDVKTALKGEDYDTATRGHRHTAPARAVGEGIYRILRHTDSSRSTKKPHTHLIYRLEFPAEDEDSNQKDGPQQSLNIERESSFLIQIKNPDQQHGGGGGFRGLKSKRKALFPAHLQGLFGQLRWHPADPSDLLNYEGCEFLLIAASDDIEEELGLDLKTDSSCCDLVRTFGEDAVASTAPLFEGTWA